MNRSKMTCILCPNGCELEVEWEKGAGLPSVTSVAGNLCPKGKDYATEEVTAPVRTVTTTVRVKGGARPLLSVRTASPVPLSVVPDCLRQMRTIVVAAPVRIGETIVENIAGTGIAVMATRSVPLPPQHERSSRPEAAGSKPAPPDDRPGTVAEKRNS